MTKEKLKTVTVTLTERELDTLRDALNRGYSEETKFVMGDDWCDHQIVRRNNLLHKLESLCCTRLKNWWKIDGE